MSFRLGFATMPSPRALIRRNNQRLPRTVGQASLVFAGLSAELTCAPPQTRSRLSRFNAANSFASICHRPDGHIQSNSGCFATLRKYCWNPNATSLTAPCLFPILIVRSRACAETLQTSRNGRTNWHALSKGHHHDVA